MSTEVILNLVENEIVVGIGSSVNPGQKLDTLFFSSEWD